MVNSYLDSKRKIVKDISLKSKVRRIAVLKQGDPQVSAHQHLRWHENEPSSPWSVPSFLGTRSHRYTMIRVMVPFFGGGKSPDLDQRQPSKTRSQSSHDERGVSWTRKGGGKPTKAVVGHEFGDTNVLEYEEIETPKPSPAHILIRILARASRNA